MKKWLRSSFNHCLPIMFSLLCPLDPTDIAGPHTQKISDTERLQMQQDHSYVVQESSSFYYFLKSQIDWVYIGPRLFLSQYQVDHKVHIYIYTIRGLQDSSGASVAQLKHFPWYLQVRND